MATLNSEFYICFSKLSTVQKALYCELLPEIEKATRSITINNKGTSQDAFTVVQAIATDRPDFFWMTGTARAWSRNDVVEKIDIEYNGLANQLSYHKRQFQDAIDSYMRLVNGETLLNKERLIHDKMVRDISYAHGPNDQTAYSALVEKKSVCAGYSKGFQLLMQRIGIPCYYCGGQAKGKRERAWGPHGWNILKLDSDYYNVDITWDDCYGESTGNISYTYYNCTDAKIANDHIRDNEYSYLPRCNGTKYSFENVFGVNPELQVLLQDGVSCHTVMNSKETFMQMFYSEVKKTGKGTIKVSFPTQSDLLVKSLGDWIEEAMDNLYNHRVGWSLNTKHRNYNNGWHRMEIILTIE